MFLTLKDDNTTGSSYLHFFYVISLITSDYLYSRVHSYTTVIFSDGKIMCMCSYLLVVANFVMSLAGHISLVICIYVDIR